ncbi:hypothetical protein [uncultured Tenacibaculum sp.]|uniref:hypothetical protein n=1 Tax=uncultured Tenacibaculum sp. TaxID=174713 RepID=UPI0026322781|nr:hypothetical protein [uncultured Tenacibaculum sp.]
MKTYRIKHKIYQVLNDKLSKKDFEKDIYFMAEVNSLKLNSFLFDLVEINYNSNTFKNQLLNVFNKHSTADEYLAISIFELSKLILDYNNINEVFEVIKVIKDKCVEEDFNYQILTNYYLCYENYSYRKEIGHGLSTFELMNEAKDIARKVFDRYTKVKEFEDWLFILKNTVSNISNYEDDFSNQVENYIIQESLGFRSEKDIRNDFKSLGLSDYEINESFSKSEEDLIKNAKEKALPLLVLGIVSTFVSVAYIYQKDKVFYWPILIHVLLGPGLIYSAILLYVKSLKK